MHTFDRNATVFVVDGDMGTSESVAAMVRLMGLKAEVFETAEDFLAGHHHHQPGCVISDLRLCGMSGTSLLAAMRADSSQMPFILMTAFADVEVAVKVMLRGAMTVIEKPHRDQHLWDQIVRALQQDRDQRALLSRRKVLMASIEDLSDEERGILTMMVSDNPNKVISSRLQISLRTVDHRRAEILAKLGMRNLKSLIWHLGGIGWPAEKLKGSEPALMAMP
jgi:FixJ family two-component response regulator